MEGDAGKGVKRKIDGDSLLPTEVTEETTSNQGDRQQGSKIQDVQMEDGAGVTPQVPSDDEAKRETLKQIIERTLARHSDPRFLAKWNELPSDLKQFLLLQAMGACKYYENKDTFETHYRLFFRSIFKDANFLANFVAGVYKECLNAGLMVLSKEVSNRVVDITHGLDQAFLGTFDFEELDKKIHTVLEWHEEGHEKYLSPSFAMVQSSGMGKTKLMLEYTDQHNKDDVSDIECKMILCMGKRMDKPPDFGKHYHANLVIGESAGDIKYQLEMIETNCKKDKVIFFFDEAQELLHGATTAPYYTILWWLRQSRKKSYVGVFAGTMLGLAEFRVFHPPTTWSRDDRQSYKNYGRENTNTKEELLLYDPFYLLTTISLARTHKENDVVDDELKDIRKYGCNGRPMFAAMLRRHASASTPALTLSDKNCSPGVITNPTMYNILLRVLLSPIDPKEWASNDNSIASILGTRVQLGLADYDFVSNAISNGYAMLVRYDVPRSGNQEQMKKFGSVAIIFPPDPVCAALAMGMMQPLWALRKPAVDAPKIQGKEPNFWVKNMARLFDQHFFLPDRGECGEVLGALYMLLCGDVLRYKQDEHMRVFEVDLEEWLGELERKTPENPEESKGQEVSRERKDARVVSKDKAQGTGCRPTLNFIQVCHNYFRSHAWFGQSMLEYMYDTATGCYVYPLCPDVDIVFPIKQVNAQGAISYHPCLVSVKCWDSIERSDMESILTSMGEYLEAHRPDDDKSTAALCLLIVIGTSSNPETLHEKLGSFPEEDSYISIVVPSKDKFGVNETIQNMAAASHISELLASHSFAYAETNESALRVTATEDYCELGKRLLEDKQQIWKKQNYPTSS